MKKITSPTMQPQRLFFLIKRQLSRACKSAGMPLEFLAVLDSWGDTLNEAEVLSLLVRFNNAKGHGAVDREGIGEALDALHDSGQIFAKAMLKAGKDWNASLMPKPRRIRLSRKKGWRLPPDTVVVSRPSKWGNPFVMNYHKVDPKTHICIASDAERKRVVEAYREFVARPGNKKFRGRIRRDLRGKNVACWCGLDQPCHGDVLLEVANGNSSAAAKAMADRKG